MEQIAQLITRWESHGIHCPAGVPEAEIAAFERSRKVLLPQDMRAYFLAVNGMGDRGTFDADFFGFWPLEDVMTIAEDLPDRASRFPEANCYFMFADHSIALPSFAIRLSANPEERNPVVSIFADSGAFEVTNVFHSFTDFVNHYLDDPSETGLA